MYRSSAVGSATSRVLPEGGWTRVGISRIEDLSDAVHGAGLEAIQMSRAPMSGSLAFAEHNGVVLSSGYIGGRVALTGPLSERMITFGLGLNVSPGTRHWFNEVFTGSFGLFMPGDEHEALYMPGTLYATVTLTAEHLELAAERRELVLDPRTLGGTGFHARRVANGRVASLRRHFEDIHAGRNTSENHMEVLGGRLIDAVIEHFGRTPGESLGGAHPQGHARIVARAREYVLENLERPLSIDEIAVASRASRRTLYRAFSQVFDDTPQSYVRKIRLHRIRRDLASEAERACTVAVVANRWGIRQLGRLSGWYRELFGEHPHETLRRRSGPFE